MSVPNFSFLAGLEVTEKFDLIYYSGWVGGWVAGWVGGRVAGWVAGESGIKAISAKPTELELD